MRPDCYSFDSGINFFDRAGVDQHFRRIHHGKKFVLLKSIRLFQELHSLETKNFIWRLMKFRREADSTLEVYKEYRVNSDCLNIEIVGRSRKEAAKLAALVLHLRGMVKSMDEDGYLVGVLEKGNINDFAEKFKVWKAISKIYVESVYLREVRFLAGELIFKVRLRFNWCINMLEKDEYQITLTENLELDHKVLAVGQYYCLVGT